MHLITLFLLALLSFSQGIEAATLLVANKSEASVSLVSVPSGNTVVTLPTGEAPHEVAVSPDGRRALVTNYGTRDKAGRTLTLVDIPSASVVDTIELPAGARPHGVEWLDDSRAVVTAEGISSLLVVDTTRAAVLKKIPVQQEVAHMVATSGPQGRAFIANIGSGTATAIDLRKGEKIRDLEAGKGSEGIALVGGGRELWVSNRGADTVTVFDAASLEELQRIEAGGFPIRVEADDVRGRVYITVPGVDGLLVFDSASRQLMRRLQFDIEPDRSRPSMFAGMMPQSSMPIGVLLSGDGDTLYVAHSSAHVISIYNASTLEQTGILPTGLEPDGMAWSPLNSGS